MSTPTQTTQLYERLRGAILTLDLAPGQPLTERGLEQRFAASRTPVRAALTRLVTDLLDVSRAEAGVLAVSLSPLPVEDAVGAALEELQLGPDAVELDVDDARIVADPVLLQRVLVNLITNALRYSPAGRAITVANRRDGDRVRILVIDHGVGIPDDRRDAVFAPFQRAGDRDNTAGLGLGLALSRGFTEGMGGTLTLEHTPGGGATFCVLLRAADEGRS